MSQGVPVCDAFCWDFRRGTRATPTPRFLTSWWKAATHQVESAGSKQNLQPAHGTSVLGQGKTKSGMNGPNQVDQGFRQLVQTLRWVPAQKSEKPLVT